MKYNPKFVQRNLRTIYLVRVLTNIAKLKQYVDVSELETVIIKKDKQR